MILFGYLLPPERSEKLILRELKSCRVHDRFTPNEFIEVINFLAIIVFSLYVSNIIPKISITAPIITKFFVRIIRMSIVSVVVSILIVSLHCRTANHRAMPLWVSQSKKKNNFSSISISLYYRFASIFASISLGYYL